MDVEAVGKFFTDLRDNHEGVPPQNTLNYNETSLTDDTTSKVMLFM